jgi:hypothetical protein
MRLRDTDPITLASVKMGLTLDERDGVLLTDDAPEEKVFFTAEIAPSTTSAPASPASAPTGWCPEWIPFNCTRCRVSIRDRRISGGGTNDGLGKPCSSSWAIHSASRTSVARPGTASMCAALSSHVVITSPRQ